MSEPHGSDCSATLIDKCTSGQSFSSINGSDSQFYSENFDFNLFESGLPYEDSSVTTGQVYFSGSLCTLSVTESLLSRISALEDSAGIYPFVVWRVQVCQIVPVLVSLARELLGLSMTDSDFCIVHRLKKSYSEVLIRVSSRKINEIFVAQRSMLALRGCFIDLA